jgi:hypothetical protein
LVISVKAGEVLPWTIPAPEYLATILCPPEVPAVVGHLATPADTATAEHPAMGVPF